MPKTPEYPPDEAAPGEGRQRHGDLTRPHRYNLTNVLVIGGTSRRRAEVARAFHQESPLRNSAFVGLICSIDEGPLRAALQNWIQPTAEEPAVNPLALAEHGTLFLDSVERLSIGTQGMLLALARRLLGEPVSTGGTVGPGRLVVGNPQSLAKAIDEGRFLALLNDAVDKVRVELELPDPGETT